MIFVIIPAFNRKSFTHACLISLKEQSVKKFKVIIVDHGSTDGTSEMIQSEFSEMILLKGNEKMWWSAATNMGIKKALEYKAKFVLTLNNDTIPEPNYIEEIYKAILNAPQNSVIGSTEIDAYTKEVLYRGEIVHWISESSTFIKDTVKLTPKNGLSPVSLLPGRGMLIPAEIFDVIGLFDEKYFPHYAADYDFTLRAKKAKFSIFCSWNAIIKTYPEASGASQLISEKSIHAYKRHLFGRKGGANLAEFYRYAFRHCPFYALPGFLILGTIRRLAGYWIK